jgi:hypothetical protein
MLQSELHDFEKLQQDPRRAASNNEISVFAVQQKNNFQVSFKTKSKRKTHLYVFLETGKERKTFTEATQGYTLIGTTTLVSGKLSPKENQESL